MELSRGLLLPCVEFREPLRGVHRLSSPPRLQTLEQCSPGGEVPAPEPEPAGGCRASPSSEDTWSPEHRGQRGRRGADRARGTFLRSTRLPGAATPPCYPWAHFPTQNGFLWCELHSGKALHDIQVLTSDVEIHETTVKRKHVPLKDSYQFVKADRVCEGQFYVCTCFRPEWLAEMSYCEPAAFGLKIQFSLLNKPHR